MPSPSNKKSKTSLRKRAEALLKKQTDRIEDLTKADLRSLVHELGTHQIELEMQNEELRRTQEELEASRQKYADLYDLAPIGYLTLSRDGAVLEANQTAAQMFGCSRRSLLNRPFASFVVDRTRTVFELHAAAVLETRTRQVAEVVIGRGKKGPAFPAWLESVAVEHPQGGVLTIHMAVMDITDRKQAEIALKNSLYRFGLLARTAGSLLQTTAPQKMIDTLCRQVMAHLDCQVFFNFLADAPAGRLRLNAYAGIPEDEARRIEWLEYGAAVCGCAARDGSRIVVERIQRSGDKRAALVRSYGIRAYACHPIIGANDTVLGTLSFGTNNRETFTDDELSLMKAVTDQVAVAMVRMADEEQIRTSEEKYRLLFENMGEGFALYELLYDDRGVPSDWRILEVNNAYVTQTGIAQDRVVGRCISEIFPQAIPEYLPRFSAVVEKQQPVEFETYSKFADRHMHVVTFPAGGRRFASTVLDITERRKAADSLIASEARYRSLFDNMIDGFALHEIVVDGAGKPVDYIFREVNGAFERLTGLNAADIVGKRVTEALPGIENDPENWIGTYGQIALTGGEARFERFAKQLGRWYSVTAYSPQRGTFATVFEDITERKRAEEALRENVAELERFNERMIGRELRMAELKQEVNDLCARLGRPAAYPAGLLKELAAMDDPPEKEQP